MCVCVRNQKGKWQSLTSCYTTPRHCQGLAACAAQCHFPPSQALADGPVLLTGPEQLRTISSHQAGKWTGDQTLPHPHRMDQPISHAEEGGGVLADPPPSPHHLLRMLFCSLWSTNWPISAGHKDNGHESAMMQPGLPQPPASLHPPVTHFYTHTHIQSYTLLHTHTHTRDCKQDDAYS